MATCSKSAFFEGGFIICLVLQVCLGIQCGQLRCRAVPTRDLSPCPRAQHRATAAGTFMWAWGDAVDEEQESCCCLVGLDPF